MCSTAALGWKLRFELYFVHDKEAKSGPNLPATTDRNVYRQGQTHDTKYFRKDSNNQRPQYLSFPWLVCLWISTGPYVHNVLICSCQQKLELKTQIHVLCTAVNAAIVNKPTSFSLYLKMKFWEVSGALRGRPLTMGPLVSHPLKTVKNWRSLNKNIFFFFFMTNSWNRKTLLVWFLLITSTKKVVLICIHLLVSPLVCHQGYTTTTKQTFIKLGGMLSAQNRPP